MRHFSAGCLPVILLFVLCLAVPYVQADQSIRLQLTEKEKQFVAQHPVIRVSNELDWPPFDFAVGAQPLGLSIDLVNMLGDRLGLTFEYVNGHSWNTLVEMFKNNEIDVLQSAYKNETRRQFGLFTDAYYKDKTVFIVSKYAEDVSDIDDLKGKTVATPKGWAYETYLTKHHPEIDLHIVTNMEEAFAAVKKGKADAAIELSGVARYLMEKNFMEGFKISGWFREYDNNEHKALHIMVRKDWPILRSMFDKALETITPGDISTLQKKWLGTSDLNFEQKLDLTRQEQMFLETHPVIRVANELDWPPFDFVKNGKPAGFAIDYVKILGEILGSEFEFINGYTWSELLEKGRNKEVDLFPGLWKSPEREEFLSFTQPYMEMIRVLVTRKDREWKQVESLSDIKGGKIALPKGYTLTKLIMEKYRDFDYILVDNPFEGLTKVSLGKADGFIGSLGIINYLIRKHFIHNVAVVSEVKLDRDLPLYMAVRKDWAILSGILNKAMEQVSSDQYDRIVEKWIGSIKSSGNLTNLTAAEKSYLNEKERITMCVQPDFLPFEAVDENGRYRGLVADFYRLMGEKIGMPVEFVQKGSFEERVRNIKNGKCDVISVVQKKDTGTDTLSLTTPYVKYPLVIATDRNAIYINSIENIPEKNVGISRHADFYEDISSRYPQVNFRGVENVEKGLARVQKGELFGLVDTAPKIGFYIQKNEMVDLKISGELPYLVEFRTGVRKGEGRLLGIFEKAINSMTGEEKKNIFQSWMTIKYEQGFDYSLLWKILLVIGIVGLFLLYRHISITQYNIKLAGLNRELTAANKKLETISYIDGLTGIPNRRKFDSVLHNEWKRCARNRQFLTVILFDIDFFKRFNDRYGHLEGDDCLKKVAEAISHIPGRPGDFVSRYGGEEFAIVLPDTDESGARLISEKILVDIQELKILHEDSGISPYLTVSVGAASAVPEQRSSPERLVDTADQLLYKAKEEGRNRYKAAKL